MLLLLSPPIKKYMLKMLVQHKCSSISILVDKLEFYATFVSLSADLSAKKEKSLNKLVFHGANTKLMPLVKITP